MNVYRVSGLVVHSDITLPSFVATGLADAGAADVVIREGEVPDRLEGARVLGPHWQLGEDRFLLEAPGIVRMMLREGRELIYRASEGVSRDEAAIFIIGTGMGILLHQRRSVVLHASAVRVGDHAVLFCGASGAGKSTLAAALGEAGHDLVADDFCRIELPESGAPLAHPDGRQLRLWEDATENLGLVDRRGATVREAIRKFYVEPRVSAGRPLPVGAVYALHEAHPPLSSGIWPCNSVDAVLALRRNAYRPLLVREMGQRPLYLHAATRVAAGAGVYTLARALDFDAMPAVIGALGTHWRDLGLMGARAA